MAERKPIPIPSDERRRLEAELAEMREALVASEADLAQEQAAVNAFRMHCRLTIGHWVDTLLDLRAEKQAALTQLRLLCQDLGREIPFVIRGLDDREADAGRAENGAAGETAVWWQDLATPAQDREATRRLYRELARRFHPDLAAGSAERAYRTTIMAAVNVAYQQQDTQTLRDLAGELDPELLADTAAIENDEIRRLRQKILRCRRRRRKVAQQLRALRQENIAKLWRRAQRLEQESEDWWHDVQQSLAREIARLRVELADLRAQVALLAQEAPRHGAAPADE